MSSVLFVQPIAFELSSKAKRSPLVQSKTVASAQADNDKAQACSLLETTSQMLSSGYKIPTQMIRLNTEPRPQKRLYEEKGEAILARSSISFHDFTDDEGKIVRRLVVLYPMTPGRDGELSQRQIIKPLEVAANEDGNTIELVDLRDFQQNGQYLEGTAAVVFSHDGRFVYMSRSARTDDEVLDILCAGENLNVPYENRFIFTSQVPTLVKNDYNETVPDPNKMEECPHTNVLGWVGAGICAWALDNIYFDSEDEQERFYQHLESEYDVVIELTEAELRAFAGDASELALPSGQRILLISEKAKAALTREHLKSIVEWYGEENIVSFYGDVIERRIGVSLPSCMAISNTHGPVPPNGNEIPTISLLSNKN